METFLPVVIETLSNVQQLVTFLVAELNRIQGTNGEDRKSNRLSVTECGPLLPEFTHGDYASNFLANMDRQCNSSIIKRIGKMSTTKDGAKISFDSNSWIGRNIGANGVNKTDLSINTSLWNEVTDIFTKQIDECEDDVLQQNLKSATEKIIATTISDVIDVDEEPDDQNPTMVVTDKPDSNRKVDDAATSNSNLKNLVEIKFVKPIAPAKRRLKVKSNAEKELQQKNNSKKGKTTKKQNDIDEPTKVSVASLTTRDTKAEISGKTVNEADASESNDKKSDASTSSKRRRKGNKKSITTQDQKGTRSRNVRMSVNRLINGRTSIRISKRVSNNLKPFKCDLIGCKYEGARKAYLTRHMSVHKIIYACKICDKKFTKQQLLTEHESEHDEKIREENATVFA